MGFFFFSEIGIFHFWKSIELLSEENLECCWTTFVHIFNGIVFILNYIMEHSFQYSKALKLWPWSLGLPHHSLCNYCHQIIPMLRRKVGHTTLKEMGASVSLLPWTCSEPLDSSTSCPSWIHCLLQIPHVVFIWTLCLIPYHHSPGYFCTGWKHILFQASALRFLDG